MPLPVYVLQPGEPGHLYKEESGSGPGEYIREHEIPQPAGEHNSGRFNSSHLNQVTTFFFLN